MKNYYQELKNLGLNDSQIEGLMVFAQGQVAEEVYGRAVGEFSAEELRDLEKKRTQIDTDGRQMSTDGSRWEQRKMEAGMEFVEKAYFEKTGKTIKELADGILNDYLERFLGMIKDLQAGMKKVATAPTGQLEELKKAMEGRDAGKIKGVMERINISN